MSVLYICEKPSQARDIAHVLGATQKNDGYLSSKQINITWCLGHLLSLAPPDDYCDHIKPWRMEILPIIPKMDEWKLIPNPNTKKQLTVIKNLLKKSSEVVIATDADREGDVIGRELLDYFDYKGLVKRLWLSALDETSIQKALENILPGQSTYPLYLAGLGRQRADWIVGMNMTMAVSHRYGQKGGGVLSVGRVQTPTLSLIVQRDEEIESFRSKDYYELKAQFMCEKGDYWAKWQIHEDHGDAHGYCIDQAIPSAVSQNIHNKKGIVEYCVDEPQSKSAPLCFSLSSLQKLCSSQYGLSAKDTLAIAQSLYEIHKLTTYPRTDCGYLPESQFSEATRILKALCHVDGSLSEMIAKCDIQFKSPVWNDKKITAHHGIIPTAHLETSLEKLSDQELKVYDEIRRHYLAQFMGHYESVIRKVTVCVDEERFTAQAIRPKVQGWKAVMLGSDESEDQAEGVSDGIPELRIGEAVMVKACEVMAKKTKPPARFSEGTLIVAMKNIAKYVTPKHHQKTLRDTSGIGTEATRADMIEKLLLRGFIERNNKNLISTQKGRALIKILPEAIKDPCTTALWEQALDDISKGEETLSNFLDDQVDILEFMLESMK